MKTVFALRRSVALVAATLVLGAASTASAVTPASGPAARWVEALDRGVVAVPAVEAGNLVSWRLLANDASDTAFDVYRDGQKLNDQPLAGATNLVDKAGKATSTYTVRTLVAGKQVAASKPVGVWADGFLGIAIDQPAGGVTPTGQAYTYTAQEASVADLDGDGRYEIILKWDPTNAKDNAFDGYTGPVMLDAYTLEGKRLWRIDLGKNIRAGAHYTQFQVYDYDGDGRAELAVRTSDGTIDGAGKVLGDPHADWREKGGEVGSTDRTGGVVKADGTMVAPLQGRILKGPEFLTIFDGLTGRALASAPYWPARDPRTDAPTTAQMKETWGDGYANRSDRFLAGTAYLDGQRPSIVMARGYYARTTVAAWDWRDGKLTQRWTFDSSTPGNEAFGGQGNHQFSVADVDGDGRDEIVYGAMALDDNGKGLWSSRLGHGDAMAVSDLDPTRPGLEKFGAHEDVRGNGQIGSAMLDARTGQILWSTPAEKDTGRAVAADIDPRFPGTEAWATNSTTLYTAQGKPIDGVRRPVEASFVVWWDGDELRELFDKNRINKWDWKAGKSHTLLEANGVVASNGTKNVPVVSADLLGDWREEVIWHTPDEKFLRVYTTPHPTARRLVTLMHDPQYRVAVAWQNTAYNQPPYPSFFIGDGMATPPASNVMVRKPQ
ncbi:rhamnogalacturonan lyase [Duganella phyllosphaerae]|uniref:Rhamnogalacturonan endolyase YesW n=1 Tax=Duganella phyllosphaerae TaxID=762836 RepID=A0A1E7WW31_9BURK|nr:rhamnogalacturonan lyase [Duganella phyllosphaerae]OFA03975.1 rhamnogalacturonan endolyase YesW precursor [Duganella phyllosphaerae]